MKNLYYDTESEAIMVNSRVTASCLEAGIWNGSITTNYCIPYLDDEVHKWTVPIRAGYEQFFTEFELSIADMNITPETREVLKDQWFCKQIKLKMLSAFKGGQTLPRDTYRALSDLFWYADDAAAKGNPTNVKIELQAIPDEDIIQLPGWNALRAALIADIDAYLAQS